MRVHDVLIVGCGPAGSTAAYILARSGLSVAVFDACEFPRPKLCGGLLPYKTTRLIRRIFGIDRAVLDQAGALECTPHTYTIQYRGMPPVKGISPLPFSIVDRNIYDAMLLDRARAGGAEVYETEAVLKAAPYGSWIETSAGRRLSGRFIIGADGALGVTRRYLRRPDGHDGERTFTASTLQVCIPNTELGRPVDSPEIHLGYVDWGYAWIFPGRRHAAVGVGGLQHKNGRKFKTVLMDLCRAQGLGDALTNPVLGHPIPFGHPANPPAIGSMLLTGDAAGFADPITGEGVFHAHRSAEAASAAVLHTIRHGGDLRDAYARLLTSLVQPTLEPAMRLHPLVYTCLERLPGRFCRWLVKMCHRKALMVIHGLSCYPFSRRANAEDMTEAAEQ
jgi:geranylgeranyl reductase family protein